MLPGAGIWFWNRFRPREGWLSLILLFLVVGVLIAAILDVGWVEEDGVIVPAAMLGLLMGVVLARRPHPAWLAWLLIALYGLLIVGLTLGELWPPARLLLYDWPALRLYWLENGALFWERGSSWVTAVAVGGRSNETITFAIIMGLLIWFLTAYLGWSAYRQRQPLLGLTLMGLLIAINGYYGAAPIVWAAALVGLAVITTAVFHFAQLEQGWDRRLVDYSSQIRVDIILFASGIGFTLLAFSFLLPTVRMNRLASFLLGNDSIAALEDRLDQSFSGIDVPRERQVPAGMPGGAGILPRAFLVGDAPELQKIIMMTASAELLDGPPGAALVDAAHWRALSYVTYSGRGWSLAEAREEQYTQAEVLPLAPVVSAMRIRQQVHWRYDNRIVRYTLGEPLLLDHAVTGYWYDLTDLVRVTGAGHNQYEVLSRLTAATADELRTADLEAVPPAIMRRYLALPGALPGRVHDLAREIAGEQPTPYDQALALERFLRQYPYSLEVAFPPEGADVVDFFLFDLQEGYCDYYASAMVVMARSLGLPARFASGFLAQEPDEEGVQTVRQIDAHAWAEIYFAGYGWVEFEPTASFASPHAPRIRESSDPSTVELPDPDVQSAPLPERAPVQETSARSWAIAIMGVVVLLGVLFWLRRRRQRPEQDEIQSAFSKLQEQAIALGQRPVQGQTPYEFNAQLQERLRGFEDGSRQARQAEEISGPAERLTALFVEHQYSEQPPERSQEAKRLWQRMKRPLWLLRAGQIVGSSRTGEKDGS